MLESNNYYQSTKKIVGTLFREWSNGYQLRFSHSKLYEMIEIQIVNPYI